MSNYKNILKGLAIGTITLGYWFLVMFAGDAIRLANRPYWNVLTISFIVSAIILNLVLVYLFYRKAEVKTGSVLITLIAPYLLLLVFTEIPSLNFHACWISCFW